MQEKFLIFVENIVLKRFFHIKNTIFMIKQQRYITFCLLMLAVLSCKTTKRITKTPPPPPPAPVVVEWWRADYDKCLKNAFDFQTLSISGRMNADIPEQPMVSGLTFSYRINIQKDSMIWAKASVMGIEGVRALITPSKIQVLDRQNKQARILPFSKIKEVIGVEVDFATLQNLLVGNIPYTSPKIKLRSPESKELWLRLDKGKWLFDYFIQQDIAKMQQLDIQDSTSTQTAHTVYSNFQVIDNMNFPFEVNITGKTPKQTAAVSLSHTKVERNPSEISFQFSIPDNFEIVK